MFEVREKLVEDVGSIPTRSPVHFIDSPSRLTGPLISFEGVKHTSVSIFSLSTTRVRPVRTSK